MIVIPGVKVRRREREEGHAYACTGYAVTGVLTRDTLELCAKHSSEGVLAIFALNATPMAIFVPVRELTFDDRDTAQIYGVACRGTQIQIAYSLREKTGKLHVTT